VSTPLSCTASQIESAYQEYLASRESNAAAAEQAIQAAAVEASVKAVEGDECHLRGGDSAEQHTQDIDLVALRVMAAAVCPLAFFERDPP
jgi:hypothetical protein